MKSIIYIFSTFTAILLSSYATAQDSKLVVTSKYQEDSLRVTDLYLQAVKKLITDTDKNNAYSILCEVLEIDPNHAPSLFKAASINPNKDKALTMAEKAVTLDPKNVEYKMLYVELLSAKKEVQKSIEVWKEILNLDNKNINRHLQMVSVYVNAAMPYAAINTLDSALILFGNRPEILGYQQYIYQGVKMHDKAIEAGNALIKITPNSAETHTNLAKSYIAASNDSLAWKHLDRAIEIDPTNIDVLIARADMFYSQGKMPEYLTTIGMIFASDRLDLDTKIGYFKKFVEKPEFYQNHIMLVEGVINSLRLAYPNSYKADVLYARHLINMRELKKALSVYKLHLNDSINQEDVYSNIIGLESYIKESRDSIIKYNNLARDLFPNSLDMQLNVSSIYLQQKEYKEAIKVATEALDIAETDSLKSTIYGFIGDIYSEMGKQPTTYKYYKKALKYNKSNIMVLNNYSYFLSEEGKELEKALTMSSLVIASEPDNATYLDTYGWILYKLERYEEAKKHLRRAIALSDKDNDVLMLHLGDVFFALGDTFSAELYWDKASKAGASDSDIAERKAKLL